MFNITPEMMGRILANITRNSPPDQPMCRIITVEEWQVALRQMRIIKALK